MTEKIGYSHPHLKSAVVFEFVDVVMESGYPGSAEDFLQEHQQKTIEQVNNQELTQITQGIKDKGPGFYWPGAQGHA